MTLCDPLPGAEVADAPDLPAGVPPLTAFYLYLTSGCNLRCRHCWIAPQYTPDGPAPDQALPLPLLRQGVAQAKPLGLRHAKLTGGEPMLHPQFTEIADYLSAEGLSLDMETNGTLIDAALARHLREHTRLEFVSVSIDGPTPEVHDDLRGVPGAFEAAVRGFRHLVAAGFRPQLIMCPHRGNVALVEDVVRLAVELGAGSVKFNPVTSSGRGGAMHARGEALDFDEMVRLMRFVRGELQQRTPIRLYLCTPPAMYTADELVRTAGDGACQVRHILGILGGGELALCGIGRTVPELCYGRLPETSVTDVWLHHPALLRLRAELDGRFPGVCGDCIHAPRCLTECVAQNYQETGQLVSPAWLCAEAWARGVFPKSRLRGGGA